MASSLKLAGPQFRMREANKDDIEAMTDVFFRSFNAPFWQYFLPDTPEDRKWSHEHFTLSLENPTDRSFVVEDTKDGSRVVAFSRWMVPQHDGNLERKWPEDSPSQMDMDVGGAFFGGMEHNREEMMGKRPHWFLELLAVHEDYQRQGIAAKLIKWGTDQADRDGLETYLDGSEVGQPYYKRRHGFKTEKPIDIPERKEYGAFHYKSLMRPPQSAA